jgi:UDP-N-acetylmuramoyl-tripeptide--D-alanyl-D-alanine ligase
MTWVATAERMSAASMNWSLHDIVAATGALPSLSGRRDTIFRSITTDSRHVEVGALFFALRGPRHDGHDFAAEAVRRGASAAVVDRDAAGVPSDRILRVPDTLRALGDLAAWTRGRHATRVVAVTGSTGKTTTKEMIAAICATADAGAAGTGVLKTEGNWNNLIGLPLTLLRQRGDEAVAVLEMGMNRPGEIARLTEIARPDCGVVTNVGPAHLQGVGGTLAGVAAAKAELFAGLPHHAAIAVNTDDAWVARMAVSFPGRSVTFGRTGELRAHNVTDFGRDGVAFDLLIGDRAVKVRLHLIGRHNVTNALAAAAIGHLLGLGPEVIADGLQRTISPAMRLEVTHLSNGMTLINDAYNANPSSVEAALVALRRFSGRSVAVLGEMAELGDESRRAHHEMGERAATLGVDLLFLLGEHAEVAAAAARAAGMRPAAIHVCGTHREVADAVVAGWQPGDTLLVKGSHAMRMDEVVRLLEEVGNSP